MQSRIFDLQIIIPPNPIKHFVYHCGKNFITEPLTELYKAIKCDVGILLTNGEKTQLYLLDTQKTTHFLAEVEGKLPTGHKKGGQSAPRFQRMYISALDAYNKRIVELCLKEFRRNGNPHIKKLVITGNGIRKTHLYDELITYFKDIKVYSYLNLENLIENISICGDEGKYAIMVQELLETSPEMLVFGKEVSSNYPNLRLIISCYESDDEKTIVFNSNTKEYKWLQSFGGTIGIRYYSQGEILENVEDDEIIENFE